MPRILDILRGKVRWLSGSGWCDQPFLDVAVGCVLEPTVEQIRFAQHERSNLGNFLQVRKALQQNGFNYSDLLPQDADELIAELQALGFTCSVSRSRVWRKIEQ